MKERLIIFTTDHGFLVPTVVAALQVAQQPEVMKIADIVIFLIDVPALDVEPIVSDLDGRSIRFIHVNSSIFDLPEDINFNVTHVPRSTLARLSIGSFIPEHYEHIIYLDGDIQIVGDILPLVAHDVAPGHIAAGNDGLWLYKSDLGIYAEKMRSYLKGIGINDPKEYFNAGILALRRRDLIEGGAAALNYYAKNSAICLHHDQSALNVVFHGKREVFSPAYNFISNYSQEGAQRVLAPRIIHFTGAAKPWFYPGAPWNGKFLESYERFLEKYPTLRRFLKTPDGDEIQRMVKKRKQVRLIANLRAPWRSSARRAKFRKYVSDQKFAV